MKRFFLIVLIAVFGLNSCVKPDDISLVSFDNFEMPTMSLIELTFTVENLSRRDVDLSDGKIVIQKSGHEIAQLIMTDVVTVPKRSNGQVVIPLRIKLTDMFAVFSLANDFRKNDFSSLTASGEATVKVGAIKRKLNVDNVSISNIMSKFDIDLDDINLPI